MRFRIKLHTVIHAENDIAAMARLADFLNSPEANHEDKEWDDIECFREFSVKEVFIDGK